MLNTNVSLNNIASRLKKFKLNFNLFISSCIICLHTISKLFSMQKETVVLNQDAQEQIFKN
jgi:hypothetical protein